VTGRWFTLCTPVYSTNKTDLHDIAEILLKVAINITTRKTKETIELVLILNIAEILLAGCKAIVNYFYFLQDL
jgi:hypothetical protein